MRILARSGDHKDDSRPDCRVKRQVKAKYEPPRHGEHGEPVKRAEEEDETGEVAQFDLTEQRVTRMDGAEPNRGNERGEGNPRQPSRIKRSETECEQDAAEMNARDIWATKTEERLRHEPQ